MKKLSKRVRNIFTIITLGMMLGICLCSCGKIRENEEIILAELERSDYVNREQPIYLQEVRVASGKMEIDNGRSFTVELWMTEGEYYDDEHEAESIYVYEENYRGIYELRTFDEEGVLLSAQPLHEVWDTLAGKKFNFPKGFALRHADYNEDGCPDFTLGQPGSSSSNIYALLTVDKTGKISKLYNGNIVTNEYIHFSEVFRYDAGQEGKFVFSSVWNKDFGESVEEKYIWIEKEGMYFRPEELTETGEPIDPDSLSQAVNYEGYLDESPYNMWKKDFIYCDFDEDDKQDRVYREVSDTDIAYRVEFGNGDKLELARSNDFFMSIKVQAADICGSYGNEILFVGQHVGSTDPTAQSDIYLYTSNFYGYERVLLPRQETEEDVYTGIETILTDRGDGCVKLECPEAEYEEIFDWELWSKSAFSTSDFFDMSSEPFVKNAAYDAAIVNYGGVPKLVFYQNVTGKWVIKDISVVLNVSEYRNSEGRYDYEVERLEHGRFEGITVDELITECYDGEIPIGMEYVPAYMETVKQCIEEYSESKLTYNLIYFDEDGIPELTVGALGTWVSMYTYQDGEVHELMDLWPYGVGGNHGYDYLPYENVIRNFNSDYAGLVCYESYYRMNEKYELNDGFWLVQSYEDEEGNVLFYEYDEDYDENNWHYYYEDREITEEEYDTYRIAGEYEPVEGEMTVSELIEALYAPLFF